jgi:Rrf2 family transcriptional regulator, cysteine metabolism repressor
MICSPTSTKQCGWFNDMNISVTDQYALRAMFDLAMQPPSENVKISDIAQRQDIPQKFLEVILGRLKQGGFVQSRRGADGGYRLLLPADQITIGQVLRFMDGAKRGARQRAKHEALADLWKRVDAAIDKVVDHTSFAEVARRWRESQSKYVPNWDI